MKILVTGGAGFIGSHTCLALLEKGFEVIVLDSYINSHRRSLQRVIDIFKLKNKTKIIPLQIISADVRDEKVLDELFSNYQKNGNPIQAVIHFAGLKSVNESVKYPLLYWDANVNSAIILLRIMNKYKCRTFVFSSSATIYDFSNDNPLKENTLINPANPYGSTKATIERLLNDIYESKSDEWKIINLRYFNPIGAHPSGLIGENPIGVPNNLFPFITQVASRKLEKLTVFGNDWPTSDGTGVRDFIHVVDVAEGHISALEYLLKNQPQIINLNLGTGKATSVLQLVKTFERVNDIEIPLQFAGRRLGDSCKVVADNSLAISCLDWFPHRDLDQMCIDGWKWQFLNPKGYE